MIGVSTMELAVNLQVHEICSLDVEAVVPVHNEVKIIERTLREVYEAVSSIASMRFLVCEDGSTDGTPEILARLTRQLPMRLLSDSRRRGYSRAVIDGLMSAEAPHVFFIDSDGQIDPGAFRRAWSLRDRFDVIVGWRSKRNDPLHRRLMSWAFRVVFQFLFNVPLHDPSCPFLLVRREVLDVVVARLGVLRQGIWWEFVARAYSAGFLVAEVPVNHRGRVNGQSQIYRWYTIPGIAWSHVVGLFAIKRELRRGQRGRLGPKAAS